MIAKILINTSVKMLNKVYDYSVPSNLESLAQIGKRVEVNFGRGKNITEGIIVKLERIDPLELEFKVKPIISILDEYSYVSEKRLKLAKYISYIYFCNVYDAIKLMLPPGTSSKNSSKNIETKKNSAIRLIKSEEEILQDIENQKIKSAKHIQLLKFLLENSFVLVSDVVEGLNISKGIINTVLKNGYIEIYKVEFEKDLLSELNIEKSIPKIPTKEQKLVIDKIGKYIYEEKYKSCLIHGVTGSGKTEVYLQLIEKVISQGKRTIVLVPEISLTYQTLNRFVSRFGNNIALLHSKMTISQRKEEYKRIISGKVDIVIGARSAIFAPVDNLGLVIIDEEHDSSYYSGTTPKYSTKDIATYICKENNAILVLGSATPEVITYYKTTTGKIELFEMNTRPGNSTLPEISLVDMKEDKLLLNKSCISLALQDQIKKNIKNGEQTMLFLNRRGYSSYITCNDCSYIFKCPNCDVAMTYHKNNNLLLCHYCSHVEKNITKCNKCSSENITKGIIGTQRLEEEVQNLFKEASILRMDADSTIVRNSHQKILNDFKEKKANILIGTQMISKGHDIPNVTLVGILGTDNLLGMNDYTASEKAFSNISQVSGRAGRANLKGRVLIQTNDPKNYILESVVNNDYKAFYEKEIEYRQIFGYPPFIDIILFEISSLDFNIANLESQRLYELLSKDNSSLYKVFSPKSPFIRKINNKYRVNVLIKANASKDVYKAIYEKINIFNKTRKKNINFTITKNPTFIG
ncbi:MAG: primosomal protein N' [Clostridia bacterium]